MLINIAIEFIKEIQTNSGIKKYSNQILVIGLHLLLLVLLFSSYAKNFIWDEDIFRRNCFLLNKMGFNRAFLRAIDTQAPGPLYQFFHLLFFPFTGYGLFKMRIVNFLIFIVTELVIYKTFKTLLKQNSLEENFFNILILLAFPGFFVTSIFCMSEAPTYFILACALFFLVKQQQAQYIFNNRFIHHIVLGILMALLIIGRTQFLVVPFIYFVAVVFVQRNIKDIIYPLLTSIIALLLSVPMFIIWGGLVPPGVAALDAGVGQLNFRNMFIVMGYFVLIQYVLLRNKILLTAKELLALVVIAVVVFCVNRFYFNFHYDSASVSFIPASLMFTLVCSFTLLSLYLATKEGFLILQSKNLLSLFCYSSALLVLLTMIKMSNYNVGVRHIGQAGLLLTVGTLANRPKPLSTYRYEYFIVMLFIALNLLVILNQLFGYPTILH